jgi:hypothetical protein
LIQSFVACCDDFSADAFFAVQHLNKSSFLSSLFLLCYASHSNQRKEKAHHFV